jgi:beta-glucosidase
VITSGLMDNPTPKTAQPIDYAATRRSPRPWPKSGSVLLKNDGGLLPLAKTAKKIVLIGAHADVGVISGGGSSQVRSGRRRAVQIPLMAARRPRSVASLARLLAAEGDQGAPRRALK